MTGARSCSSAADLHGDAFCRAYARAADEWLTGLFDQATDGDPGGLALVAVGATAGASSAPTATSTSSSSTGTADIGSRRRRDLVPGLGRGHPLDHSVRRPGEVLELAAEDLRVALGLLDARVVCGDAKVAEPVLEGARDRWARQKPPMARRSWPTRSPSATGPTATSASCSNPT